jgi:hypothetical protein
MPAIFCTTPCATLILPSSPPRPGGVALVGAMACSGGLDVLEDVSRGVVVTLGWVIAGSSNETKGVVTHDAVDATRIDVVEHIHLVMKSRKIARSGDPLPRDYRFVTARRRRALPPRELSGREACGATCACVEPVRSATPAATAPRRPQRRGAEARSARCPRLGVPSRTTLDLHPDLGDASG